MTDTVSGNELVLAHKSVTERQPAVNGLVSHNSIEAVVAHLITSSPTQSATEHNAESVQPEVGFTGVSPTMANSNDEITVSFLQRAVCLTFTRPTDEAITEANSIWSEAYGFTGIFPSSLPQILNSQGVDVAMIVS